MYHKKFRDLVSHLLKSFVWQFARVWKQQLNWVTAPCLGPKSASWATVILLNPNCHIKKAVYITVKLFKYEAE